MFDQDLGLIQPFTAKENQYLIADLHQNNSSDVFMFPLQSRSHLRRAAHRKLGLTVFNSFFCIQGKLSGCAAQYLIFGNIRQAISRHLKFILLTVRCVSAMRHVLFTVNSSSAVGLSSDEHLMTHSTSRLS